MKHRIILMFVLAGICASAFAQIRDYIYIVRPVYDENVLAIFESTALALEKNGIKDVAEYVREAKDGGFGSGFLITASNGKDYVVTNRHVVVDATGATLEVETADGETEKIAGAKIVAVDDEVDLALIELPEGTLTRKSLQFAPSKPKDGDDVLTAGYPGLGGKPAWQLGKGAITNAVARVPELVDIERSTLIQHSAQVDPGNSGGPLLIANAAGREGYYVLGVNTWKVSSRQAANFAIPASAVEAFVERAVAARNAEALSAALETRGKDFTVTSAIDNEDDPMERSRRIARYISLDYVSSHGEKALLDSYSSAPTSAIQEIMETLIKLSPIEGMRLAIAYEIDAKLMHGNEIVKLSPSAEKPAMTGERAGGLAFAADGTGSVETGWILEASNWRLDSFTGTFKADEITESKGTAKMTFEPPYYGIIYGQYVLQDNPGNMFLGGIEGNAHYFGIGAEFGGSIVEIKAPADDPWASDTQSLIVKMSFFGRLQFPVSADPVSFVPYADFGAGFQTCMDSESYSGVFSSYAAGLNICFGPEAVMILGIEIGRESLINPLYSEYDYEETFVSVSLGFGGK